MKVVGYIIIALVSFSSCDLQVSLELGNTRSVNNTYNGIADCDEYILLNGTEIVVTIDQLFDDEDVEVDLGDGLSFDGTADEDGVITLDNRTRQRLSNGESLRLTNGELEPGFINDYDFTFNVSENSRQRGKCTVELNRN